MPPLRQAHVKHSDKYTFQEQTMHIKTVTFLAMAAVVAVAKPIATQTENELHPEITPAPQYQPLDARDPSAFHITVKSKAVHSFENFWKHLGNEIHTDLIKFGDIS